MPKTKKIKKIKKPVKSAKKRKPRKKIQSEEIIFDSTVGNTDALFVDNPAVLPQQTISQPEQTSEKPKPKTFWQKLFSIINKKN